MAPVKRKLAEINPTPQPARVAVCPSSVDELVRLTSSLTRTLKLASRPELKDGLVARSSHLNLIASFVHSALADLVKTDRQTTSQSVNRSTPTSATQRKAHALYLCGRPGSGKSACVSAVVQRLFGDANKRSVKSLESSDKESSSTSNTARLVAATDLVPSCLLITLNAMSASNPLACITTILSLAQTATKARNTNPQTVDEAIEQFRSLCDRERHRSTSRYVVLVVDELDALLPTFRARSTGAATEARAVIETLFEMAALGELVMVALSNDINLIDSLTADHQPKKLVFSCYSQQEMAEILVERLKRGARDACFKLQEHELPLFDPKAIDFIVAAAAKEGDLRSVIKLASACITHVPLTTAGLVNINALTVAKMKTTLGIGVSSVARASSLSSHQQCLLAAMAALQAQADHRRIEYSSLHTEYTRLSKSHKFLLPMSVCDLETALQALEGHGFVKRQIPRGGKASFVTFIADPTACSQQCSDAKLTALFEIAKEKRSAKKQKL